jgi:hypothetical protein
MSLASWRHRLEGLLTDEATKTVIALVGLVISVVGLVISTVVLFVGRGVAVRLRESARVRFVVQPQLFISDASINSSNPVALNACTVWNEGEGTAEECRIQVWSTRDVPFKDLEVRGAEGHYEIEALTDSYARIGLDRLVGGDTVTVTVRTDEPTALDCDPNCASGPAQFAGQGGITLSRGDFGVLLGTHFAISLVSILVVVFVVRNTGTRAQDIQAGQPTVGDHTVAREEPAEGQDT